MKANFREMFENYLPDSVLDTFSDGEIQKISLDESSDLVRVNIALPFVPDLDDVILCEQALSKTLLKRVRFSPSFAPELFSLDVFDYVIDELKFRSKNPNGFFSDLKLEVKDKTLTLYLSHGGKEILEKAFVNTEIANIIEDIRRRK